MSEENVESARRLFEAFARTLTEGTGDFYALLDPDVEVIPIAPSLKERPTTATTGCGNGSRT